MVLSTTLGIFLGFLIPFLSLSQGVLSDLPLYPDSLDEIKNEPYSDNY